MTNKPVVSLVSPLDKTVTIEITVRDLEVLRLGLVSLNRSQAEREMDLFTDQQMENARIEKRRRDILIAKIRKAIDEHVPTFRAGS